MSASERLKILVVYAILMAWTLIISFPLYWVVIGAFKPQIAWMGTSKYVPWVDFKPDLLAWDWLFFSPEAVKTFNAFKDSVIATVGGTGLAMVFGSMAAYGLSRFEYRLGKMRNNDIAFWFVSQRMFPPAVMVAAFVILYRELGLLDTRLGLVIMYTSFNLPFVVWIMQSFFASVPRELEESALIDGCSRFGSFVRIALPLAAPGLVSVGLFSAIFTWNEYLFAMILTFVNVKTVPLLVAGQMETMVYRFWNMCALVIMSALPSIILAVWLERYFTKGLTMGALK